MSAPVVTEGLLTSLLKVQAELPTLPKNATNPHFKSKFTPLDTIVEIVGPILSRNGLVWSALPCSENGRPALRYRLAHAATGETIEDVMPLLLSKEDSQGMGSALTYARRYALCAVLNLVSDEDDDGNSASRQSRSAPAAKPELVTAADIQALGMAAGGLTSAQIKLAMGSVGVDAPVPFVGKSAFNAVPKDKAAQLATVLSGMEREK